MFFWVSVDFETIDGDDLFGPEATHLRMWIDSVEQIVELFGDDPRPRPVAGKFSSSLIMDSRSEKPDLLVHNKQLLFVVI